MTQAMIAIPGSRRLRPSDAQLVQAADPAEQIEISIYARRNARPEDVKRNMEAENLKLPSQRHYLTDAEFDRTYGADPRDLDHISAWAKECGLKVLDVSVARRSVRVKGSISDINKAFGTQLNEYSHAKTGRYRGREGELHVPDDLVGVIDGVFGLDTRKVGRPRFRRSRFSSVPLPATAQARAAKAGPASPVNPFPGSFFPTDLAALYDYPPKTDGSGQNIAIFAFNGTDPDPRGGYSLPALQTYFERLGGVTPSITDVVVSGPGNNPGPDTKASGDRGDATGEVMLDMCIVGAAAPGAKIFMYFTQFTSKGWVDALHQAITDKNNISVISISYGNPESDPQSAWTAMGVRVVNAAMEAAAAKGITILTASGDDGSSDGVGTQANVDFPASSPHAMAVGGTKLVATHGARPAIASEVVWNEVNLDEGATGGGISALFTKPMWQNGVNVPPSSNPPHKIGRGLPDVAAVGDPETGVVVMHINGRKLDMIGGTSASAPLWAALVARLNQGLSTRCGDLNPLLYTRFSSGVLRDIVKGNNGAYAAGPGWDACTGLGTPRGQALLAALSGNTKKRAGAKRPAPRRPAAKPRVRK
ncbi:S53 family peptidase [Bradyrhizobium sp. 21]|uniref:S53 family peptidase n=1 Tax=Bradyrhizobium sp. 21 TaxID=2782666 RepID=UPI001FF7146C|nr:S53 family peptidase [Bradyrhizobium sp. 21]MCK1386426.1 S53 family peptidase [Bradyrhizobium sp. 21]